MKAIRLVLATALGVLICMPGTASHAAVLLKNDVTATPTPSSFAAEGDDAVGTQYSPSEYGSYYEGTSDSSDSNNSSDGETSDSGTDGDADNSTGMIDTDQTREELELRYGDPADVALAPKLLLPLLGGSTSKTKNVSGQMLSFDVIQLQHQHGGGPHDRHIEPELMALKSQTAQLTAVPLDIRYARISFKTPAQEFFDGAWVGIAGMASSALALGSVAFIRARRK